MLIYTPMSNFLVGENLWIFKIYGTSSLSFTDNENQAIQVKTKDAHIWLPVLQLLTDRKVVQVNIAPCVPGSMGDYFYTKLLNHGVTELDFEYFMEKP